MGRFSRLRPRFSLRAMMLAFVVLAAALGWLAAKVRQAQRQAAAVARIEELGGTVVYDFGHYLDDAGEGNIDSEKKPTDWRWLREQFGDDIVSRVYYVRFVKIGFPDHGPGTTDFIYLSWPIPTALSERADGHVHVLASLPGLHSLDLGESAVSDRAIPHLAKLTELRWLSLRYTNVTAEGVEQLRKLLPECEISWSPPRPNRANSPPGPES